MGDATWEAWIRLAAHDRLTIHVWATSRICWPSARFSTFCLRRMPATRSGVMAILITVLIYSMSPFGAASDALSLTGRFSPPLLAFASEKHHNQRRKDAAASPCIIGRLSWRGGEATSCRPSRLARCRSKAVLKSTWPAPRAIRPLIAKPGSSRLIAEELICLHLD